MISFRERELMMVQKFLQDDAYNLLDEFNKSIDKMSRGETLEVNHNKYSEFSDYSNLVEYVKQHDGYDTFIRIEEILTPEELEKLENEREDIEKAFSDVTKLNKKDAAFVFSAAVLQVVRQILQPKLDFEKLLGEPMNDEQAKKKTDTSKTEDKIKKEKGKSDYKEADGKKYYYASTQEIADINHVPYDAISGSKKFDISLGAGNHRYKTLGHDPVLGLFFGTCNILTNTLTTNKFESYHVKKYIITEKADTLKTVGYSYKRFEESKPVVAIALAKQIYHIKTDEKSKAGIPLPFIQLLLDEKTIQKLCDMHIDYNTLKNLALVGTQAALSEFINFVIATIHRVFMAFEVYNELGKEGTKIDAIKDYHIFNGENMTVQEVRTRKVLLLSNSLASVINIVVVGVMTGVKFFAEDPTFFKELNNLDVGGIIDTIIHLLKDSRMILKIKKQFIADGQDKLFQQKLSELEEEAKKLGFEIV